jgi:hypothetical protein
MVDVNASIVPDDADSAGSPEPGWSETVDSDRTGTWQEAVTDLPTDLPDATAVRDSGDGELPTELVRGGLGVVSQVRRVSRNRPVALKLIKAGTPADDAELREFPNEAEAVAPSPGKTVGGGPAGRTVQTGTKLAGCGCFGCSSVLFLAGALGLVVLVAAFVLPNWRANHRYLPATCQVLDKRLGSNRFDAPGPGGQGKRPKEAYRPEIHFRYEVNGRVFETWGYDATGIYSDNRAAQQALVDSFRVGSTYPCWYDPDSPEKAVLVRGQGSLAYVLLILPLAALAVGGLGFLIAWKTLSAKPIPITPTLPASSAPEVPGSVEGFQPRAAGPRDTIDPSKFGDPVAARTDWGPATSSAANFQEQKLVEVDPDRLEFRPTASSLVFALSFILFGAGAVVVIVSGLSSRGISRDVFLGLAAALGFAFVGILLFRSSTTPIVLDRRNGFFWKGRTAPDEVADVDSLPEVARLEEVHALQGIKCQKSTGRLFGTVTIYELNLVLNDGTRYHLVNYVSRRQFERDASTLARFLGRPFWDAAV